MEKKTDLIYEVYMGDDNSEFTRLARQRIHWICKHVQGLNVLDVGCSQGISSILLGRENKKVIGIDPEKACIDFAKSKLQLENDSVKQSVRFIQEDFLSFESDETFFDTVLMTEVLEHIFSVRDFLQKAQKLAKTGGRIVVTVPFGINDYYDHKRTYYFAELYAELNEFFEVEQVEFFGKWIGYICKNNTGSARSLNTVDIQLVKKEERAFYDIERALLKNNEFLSNEMQKEIKQYAEFRKIDELAVKLDNSQMQLQKIANWVDDKESGYEVLKQQLENENKMLREKIQVYEMKIDEMKSQIELVYKVKLEDSTQIKEHLKTVILQKDEKITELKEKVKQLQAKIQELASLSLERKNKIENLTKKLKEPVDEKISSMNRENVGSIKKPQDEKQKYNLQNNNKDKEIEYWKHRYEVLEKSKLGRFTLTYWKVRDRWKKKIKEAFK